MSADSGMCYPMIIAGLGFGLSFLIGDNWASINNVERILKIFLLLELVISKTLNSIKILEIF